MGYTDAYNFWLADAYFDELTKSELESIRGNIVEIEDRFYKDLEFGTGGLRGIIGAGTNRMNTYTVRKATQGLAAHVSRLQSEGRGKGVVIAYDCRYMSQEFSMEAARVLAGNGIKAWIFDELRPTPELSFAVRQLGASAGIVVTASHNPKEYNGYKVYGPDGGQLSLEDSNQVLEEINKISDITDIKIIGEKEALQKDLLEIIGDEMDNAYINSLKTLSVDEDLLAKHAKQCRIVYTPLHGSGNKLVRRILKEKGFENVAVVPEQEMPDPAFSTVVSPNPEDKAAFTIAINLAEKCEADIIIGTDPDSDRVGVLVRATNGEYIPLTGNQAGCLILNYILSNMKRKGTYPKKAFVVKTIVTTEMARKIAESYDVELIEVLTGFKFIGEQIRLLDEFGDKKFLFGFEESYGYLAGTYSRDKDGVVTSMLIAEMTAFYKSRGMTLYDGLDELFKAYGYTIEGLTSFTQHGKEGLENIKKVMNTLRAERVSVFKDSKAIAIRDYLRGERFCTLSGSSQALTLPESDVLYYEMSDGSWFCIRPSGTEPKIKIYFGVTSGSMNESKLKLKHLEANVLEVIKSII